MKPPTAAMLLLALVVTSAADQAAADWTAMGGNGRRHGGHHHHSRDDGGRQSLLTGLTQCVTRCGTDVTACFLQCYKPLVSSANPDPVVLPLCLLNCTNTAMICANSCSSNII